MDYSKYPDYRPEVVVKHRRKVPFEPAPVISEEVQARLLEIQRLDQKLGQFILTAEDYRQLVIEDAWPTNFHHTTALEGNPLDLEEVREITRRSSAGEVDDSPSFPIQEIYNHLYFWLAPEALTGPWTPELIQLLHFGLMLGTDEPIEPGQFRTRQSQIVNSEGDEVFVPAPPGKIEEELEALLEWLHSRGRAYMPLVAATLFFHEFESIHPFLDGNGRVGRVLFHQYLQHNGLPNAHLCTIEAQLTQNAEAYYNVLAWTDHESDYGLLLDYFSEAVLESYEEAVDRFSDRDLLTQDIDEVKHQLLVQARDHDDWFSSRQATDWVSGRSQQTVRKHLNELVDQDLMVSEGQTSAKRYQFRNPLADARRQMLEALDQVKEGIQAYLEEEGSEDLQEALEEE